MVPNITKQQPYNQTTACIATMAARGALPERPWSSQQQKLPTQPPPWAVTPTTEPSFPAGVVPSLQDLVCAFLAQHLHTISLLDDLPEHLAASVRGAIRRDRSLLSDDGLGVWCAAP